MPIINGHLNKKNTAASIAFAGFGYLAYFEVGFVLN
jgi:hypothetical protein